MSSESTLPDWLAQGFAALMTGDIAGYVALYAEEAVHEFPFARPGAPERLEGRGAIAAYMAALPERIRFGSLSDLRIRNLGGELIIEATGHHHRVRDDAPLEIRYVWFITVAEGQITHLRDYMNPLQLAQI
ncbi:nuclear transport factor 2 family protein [Thioclava sp. BHET1]|nr:nuclear transport factor 2 family protein [Thioclava sp. BHET1]